MSKRFLSGINVTGTATLNTVADAGSNTDKFLVLDASNNVSYRTAAELYADLGIGALPAAYTSTLKHEVKASQTISKGQAVYVSSADGTNMIVSKASNVSEATSSKTMGLLETSLVTNGKGNVITEGLLSGLNTNGANAGDPVWLGVDGALIFGLINKPVAPAHLVFIGIVTRANANNGEIFVKVQNGFEMKELHNYAEGSVQNNEVIVYESATSLYKPKSIPTILGYTPVPDSRTLTINGTTYDLSANRAWTITTDASARSILRYVATANQTTFTISGGYTPGLTDVYRNGVKLDNSTDFTATNGTTIVLTNGASVNDVIEVYRYQTAFLANNALRVVTEFVATAGQTTFNVTYNSGLVDVFYNGSKLVSSEFTAGNGTTIVLNFPCNVNDSVAVHAYSYAVGAFTGQAQLNGTGLVRMSGTTVTYDNATYATQSYVTTAVANLVNSAPATLDTLNELATALGNDANFATTITTSISTKQAQLNGTGFVKVSGTTVSYDNNTYLTSINSSQVTTALGYTPYNATNPSGYITSSALSSYLPLTGGTLTGALSGTSATFSSSVSAATNFRLNSASFSQVAILDGGGGFAGGYNFNINSGTAQHDSTGASNGYWYQSDGQISFFANSSASAGTALSPRMRITSGGDVAIGDTSASANLWVKNSGASNTFGARNTNASFGATIGFFGADRNTTNNSFYYIDCYNYGSGTYRFRVADSGAITSASSITATAATFSDIVTNTTGGYRTLASQGYILRNDANNANLGGFTRRSVWTGTAALDTQIFAETGYGIFLNVNGSVTTGINILSSGNVGIGTSSPESLLQVGAFSGNNAITIGGGTTGVSSLYFGDGSGAALYRGFIEYQHNGDFMRIGTDATERMRITSGGLIGIRTTTPARTLSLYEGSIGLYSATTGQGGTDGYTMELGGTTAYLWNYENDSLNFGTNNTERIKINSDGRVWINGAISGLSGSGVLLQVNGQTRLGGTVILHNGSNVAQEVRLSCNGAASFFIDGALSKNSGSFRIDHPLESMTETHQLVHSFVEAPQADLYYRGKLTLVNGKGQANIDEIATMTEGTFEALCREVQCFTTNETGWDLVKGKVIGNIIYIESQNTNSTDEISWLVIGERKDKHMMDTFWTDENGRVIVEPLKETKSETENK